MTDPVPSTMVELVAYAERHWRHNWAWWEREAYRALIEHRVHIIPARNNRDLYLLRFWLHEPKLGNDEFRLESGSSAMLHYFARPDDDLALHDHPWDFQTTILSGSYFEHLPPMFWDPRSGLGPPWDQRIEYHRCGETMEHNASDLHCVGTIAPDTWTLMRTGPRVRSWGFFPPGQPWQPWRTYLAAKRAA